MSDSSFKPAWWLRNSHLQTLWPALCRGNIDLQLERERVELPDGDFVDLDWLGKDKQGPIVLILHGFEGSINSHYAKGMLQAVAKQGWRGVFMHFRGCSGEPNRLSRSYHSGDTKDVDFTLRFLREREANTPFAAVGYSLGGNVLLKWLGETGAQNPLTAAIAISVPFELQKASKRIGQGFSRLYQWHLLKCVRARLVRKFQQVPAPFDLAPLTNVTNLHDFDGLFTAPIHGFASADEYYLLSSSRQYLHAIRVPTLLLHAADDPFMTQDTIPAAKELSPHITLEVTKTGGHVGFVSGALPWRPTYWLEERVPAFLQNLL